MRTRALPSALNAGRNRPGLSLVELTIVVAILALLSAMAVPRFANSLAKQRARSAGHRVAGDLAYAKRQARIRGQACTVEFDPAASRYVLRQIQGIDHKGLEYTVSLSDPPYRARFISVDFGGDALIRFDGFGTPDSGGAVLVEAGTQLCTVTLDAGTGECTVE